MAPAVLFFQLAAVAAPAQGAVGGPAESAAPIVAQTPVTAKNSPMLASAAGSFGSLEMGSSLVPPPAANASLLGNIYVAEPAMPFHAGPDITYRPSRRTWAALLVAEHSAAAFDAWSTRRAIQQGRAEANPLLRPFADSNGLYAAIQVAPVFLDYLGRHMQRSEHGWQRRAWWLPQGISTASSLFAGSYNLAHSR